MSRRKLFMVFGAIVIGVGIGCGPSNQPAANGGGDEPPVVRPGDAPKPVIENDLPAKKAKLAELKKAVAAKENELVDLKAQIDALQQEIAQAEGADTKVYTKLADLLADMPKDSYPKGEGISRAAAKKWLEANLKGRTIEWTDTITKVEVTGDDPFKVNLGLATDLVAIQYDAWIWSRVLFGQAFKFDGGETCVASLGGGGLSGRKDDPFTATFTLQLTYPTCSKDEATSLQRLANKKVTFRAKIENVSVGRSMTGKGIPDDAYAIAIDVRPPSLDGFLPEASKPKGRK